MNTTLIKKLLLLLDNEQVGVILPAFSNISIAKMNTTASAKGAADQFSWSQAFPITFDPNNNSVKKVFTLNQETNGGTTTHRLIYANDGVWADNGTQEGFLSRGSIAYDSVNRVAHILWVAGDPGDGIIYRRYTENVSGSSMTGFTKDTNVNLQLDFQTTGTMSYEHPIMLFCNDPAFGTYGALVAIWSCRNAGVDGGNQIRASMCVLGETADRGKLAINWKAVTTTSVSLLDNAPAVIFSALEENTNVAIMWPSAVRIANKDLVICYYNGANQLKVMYKRFTWDSGDNDWSGTATSAIEISNVRRAGSGPGYLLNYQLGTKITQDSNGVIWFGFANYNNGDTASIVSISNDTVGSVIDVYAVGGDNAHSYAPCIDIAAYGEYIIVTYIATSTQHIYGAIYKNGELIAGPTLLFDDATCDIPLIEYNDTKLHILFRDTDTLPYDGWYGTIDL